MNILGETSLKALFSRPAIAVSYFIFAMMLIPLNDAFIKVMSSSLSIFEIMGLRSLFSSAMVLLLPGAIVSLIKIDFKTIITLCIRSLCLVMAMLFFFLPLATLSLAETTAIFFTAPLLISLLSVPLLGEKLGVYRMFAVVTGMIGVLIIVQPGTDRFQLAYIMPIMSAVSYASFQLITRYIRGRAEVVAMVSVQNLTYFFVGFIGVGFIYIFEPNVPDGEIWSFLLRQWETPDLEQFILLFVGACILLNLAFASSNVYSNVEATFVAPFEYIALPMAVLWGIVIWGDWPNITTWIGIICILSGGIIMVYRENRQSKAVSSSVPMRASAANASADIDPSISENTKKYPENPFCF